jgi:electron transfer flavoprotein beta subunit
MPALLTIQSGISPLRYATLMGIKKAKTKEVRRVSPDQLTSQAQPTVTLQRIYLPHRKKGTQIFSGTPAETASKLADVLKFEVRVI